MGETTDYDNLLRSVFDSCDKNGNGSLSTEEFSELCEQLCLENEKKLLRKILFKGEASQLDYNSFRDVLLLLLAGNLTEDKTETKPHLNGLYGDLYDSSTATQHQSQDDENLNKQESGFGETYFQNENYPDLADSCQDQLLIDFSSDTEINSNKPNLLALEETFIYSPSSQHTSEEDSFQEEKTSDDSLTYISNHNRIYSSSPVPKTSSNSEDPNSSQSSLQAQEALASVWIEVIGDFETRININQLQNLFQALSLSSSRQDVERLFEMLDEDRDGFVFFNDFTKKMSMFMNADSDNLQHLNLSETETPTPVTNMDADVSRESRTFLSSPLSPENHKMNPLDNDTNNVINNKTITSNTSSENDVSKTFEPTTHNVGPQYQSSLSIAIKSSTADPNENDTMSQYQGAPAYRKKRRSSQLSLRNRRRPTRLASLPHYHPMRRRSVEDCPLSFLSDGEDRFVSIEKIRDILIQEGFEDPEEILGELGIGKDDLLSIEVLSESFEEILKDNSTHFAICSLYKYGLIHYKSERDQEKSEKKRQENTSKHLDELMEEQEERMDKLEEEYKERIESIENRYKSKLSRYKLKLETDRDQIEMKNQDELNVLHQQINKLNKIQKEFQNKLKEKEDEKLELERRCEELEDDLGDSKQNVATLRTSMTDLRDHSMAFNQNHCEQTMKIERMLEEYKEESKKLQDKNQLLLDHLSKFDGGAWGGRESQTSDEATKEEENIFNKFPNSKKTSSLISNKNKSTFNSPPQKYVNSISIIPSSVKTRASSFHPPKTDFPSNSPFYIRSQSSVSVNNRWSLATPGNLKNETL